MKTWWAGWLAFVCACAPEQRSGELMRPSRDTFRAVSGALERRCATLDCHGQSSRNLRLYSGAGLRLSPNDVPGDGATTDAEHEASYRSIVGLEPEALSDAVEGMISAEALTLVRKPRGDDAHRPGPVVQIGDDTDRCLRSWVEGRLDQRACEKAAAFESPAPP